MSKLDFYRNGLINEVLVEYYKTFALTLDTLDFVPPNFDYQIKNFIFKDMNKKIKEVIKMDKLHSKEQRKKDRQNKHFVRSKSFKYMLKKFFTKNNISDENINLTTSDIKTE